LFLGRLISTVRPSAEPAPIFLTSEDIDLLTSSFFRASILLFHEYSNAQLNLYSVNSKVPPHTHNALDDAIEQAEMFERMREVSTDESEA
jgi:hypothetical protein